jgi:hypothetical protein
MNRAHTLGWSSLTILVALYIVGAVSHGSLRHEVQTLPLWVPIVLGFRGKELAKWAALPCYLIWLTLMTLIWLFLLGWAKIISGHFAPVEIAMTLAVGIAAIIGIGVCLRWRTSIPWWKSVAVAVLLALLQVTALRISFLPGIANQ